VEEFEHVRNSSRPDVVVPHSRCERTDLALFKR
jgi:hypothetical protein